MNVLQGKHKHRWLEILRFPIVSSIVNYNKLVNIYIYIYIYQTFVFSVPQKVRKNSQFTRIKWRSFACLTVPPLRNFCVSFNHNIWVSMEDSEVTRHCSSFLLFNIFVSFGIQSRIFSTKASHSRSVIPDASTFVMAANKTRSFMQCFNIILH